MTLTRIAIVGMMLLAGSAAKLTAQAGVIRGYVVRAGQPLGLPDAELVLRPSGAGARTDAQGFFEFRGVAPGRVELTVRRVGFAPAVVMVQVDRRTPAQVDISLEPIATVLDPIVTTATREHRSLSEVPAAMSVADTTALRRGRTVGLNETLRMMPGVQAAARHGTDEVSIGIRGSGARGRQAVRGVAVLLDGIPLTESDGAARLDLIELAAARQVEVLRGPASALYAGSPGGVVNVVSRSGRDSPGVSVGSRAGAFGFRKFDGHGGGVLAGGRGSGFAAASYTRANGYRAHSDGDVLRGQVALDYTAGPSTQVAVEAAGSRLDSRLPGSITQAQADSAPGAAAFPARVFGFGRADNRYRAGVRLEQSLGAGTAAGYFLYGGRTLRFPIPLQIVDLNLHRVQSGARLRSGRILGSPIDATIGLDYDNIFGLDHRWRNDTNLPDSLLDNGHFSVPNLGAYTQFDWQLTPRAEVSIGLRYDRVVYRFESSTPENLAEQRASFDQLSPRLSALFSLDAETSLYASFGRGFEVPVIGELSPSPGAPVEPSLRPKSLWNYEIGARRRVAGSVLLEGSVFYAPVRGEFVPVTRDLRPVPQNASRSRNIGVELAATARASRHVELGISYTFLDLRLQEFKAEIVSSTGQPDSVSFAGKLLPGVPRHRLTGDAYLRPAGGVQLGVQVEWQSVVYVETSNADAGIWYLPPRPGQPPEGIGFRSVPARALVHLDAAWRLGPATIIGSVENLFGLEYTATVIANEARGQFYEPGPPASLSLGLRLDGIGIP